MKKFLRFLLLAALMVPLGARAQSTPDTVTMATSGVDTLSTCSAIIYDDGGATGSYSTNCQSTLVLLPNVTGQYVTISGTSITEGNWDYLTIYEGVGTTGNIVFQDNVSGVETTTIPVLSAAAFTIVFLSDGSVVKAGFEINVSCSDPPSCLPPTAAQALVSGDTATLSWTDATASAWDIVWGPMGFNPDTVTFNTDYAYTTSFEITGLAIGVWQAYVRANCGGEDVSTWYGPISVPVGLYYMSTTGSDTLRTCGTVIYDDGGLDNNYSNSCQSTLVILPGQANSVVSISGTSYTEGSYDYLYIYDGIGTEGDVLWTDYDVSASQTFGPFMSDAITIVFHSDVSVNYSGFEINVSCAPVPTCARPDSLTIDSVGTDFITLSWQDPLGSSWTVEYGPAGFIPGDVSNPNIHFADFTTTTGTITNLSAGVNYDFYLMSVCGSNEGDTSWTRMVNTYTACDAISTLPYFENFDGLESGSSAQFHPCWTKGNNFNADYPYVYSYSYMGLYSNALYSYIGSWEAPDGQTWAVMPTLDQDIELNTLELTFTGYPCYTYDGYCHNLLVGVIDSAAYTPTMSIDTIAVFNITTEETKYVSFSGYEGTGKNIIFLAWLDGNSSYAYVAIDDINLHLLPSCERPDSLTLIDADSSTLQLSWWTSDESNSYLVEWRNADSTTAAYSFDNVGTSSFTITGLTPNTLYDVRVRTICGDDSSIAVVGQFRTSCVSVTTFPWTEGFEGATTSCWSNIDYNNYSGDDWTLSTNAHTGSYSIFSSYYSSAIGSNWLISPAIEIPEDMDAATLSWYISGGAYMGIVPSYAVKVSTGAALDTSTYTTLLMEGRDDDYGVWEKRSVSLAQYAGQTIHVAFARYANDDDGLYLDDITIAASEVPEVTLVGTDSPVIGLATTYTARLDGGLATGLTWSWSSVRATASTATMTTVSPSEITMLYATAGTDTLRLIGTNTFGADTAYLVVNPIAISYSALPYSTGFEATDDTAWTISNASNGWYIDTAVASTGLRSLYISQNNGTDNTYNNGNASNSYAYKAFNFATAGQYGISFDWRNEGENNYDYIQVDIVPASDTNMVGSDDYFYMPEGWINLSGNLSGNSNWQNYSGIININTPGVYYVCLRWRNDGSMGTNPAGAIDNIEIAAITCPAPVALTIDNITTNTASFHWTPTGSETSWQVKVGSLAPVIVTDTFYTITGLNHSTNYSIKVRGICGAGDSSLVLGGSFWTECDVFQIPYYIHFNSNPLNVCWSDVVSGGSTPSTTWATYATYGYDYIASYASYVNNPTSDYLISPAIQIPATDTASLRLVLRIAGVSSSSYASSVASCEVLVSPTGTDSIAAFTDTLLIDTLNSTTFEWRRLPVSSYAGQTIRFAIRNTSRMSGQLAVYDAAVRRTNEPMYVVYGTNSTLTGNINNYMAEYLEGDTTTMTLSWTSTMAAAGQAVMTGATTDSMQIVYSAGGIDTITFIAANSFGADTTIFNVHVYHCDVISTFPYAEGFEAENPCWSQEGDATWTIGVGDYSSSTGSHSGASNARITHTDRGNVTKLISPVLNLGAGAYTLSFWHVQRVWSGDQDELRVYYRTSQTDTWHQLMEFTDDIQTWTKDSIDLPSPTSTYQIAFEMTDDYGYGVAIDDVVIGGASVVCPAPAIDSISATEANVYVHFTGNADEYEVAYCEGTWNNNPGLTVSVNVNHYTFTGLSSSTQYTIGVRAVCGEGFYSEWVTRSITTADHPCYAPTGVAATNITLSGATIAWTPGEEGQTNFELRYSTAGDTTVVNVTENPYTLTGLLNATEYSVAVRAICGEGNYSDWSTPATFTTASCQMVQGVNVPTATITTSSAVVNWTANGSSSYEVGYGPLGTTTDNCTRRTTTTNSYTITGLEEGTNYVVYVRSICGDGIYSDWTAGFNFMTTEVGIDDVDNNAISLYPNPASSTVTLTGIEGEATVTVVDMNGRETGKWKVESGKLTIDVSSYAQGAYFVRITGERVNAIRKLIVR